MGDIKYIAENHNIVDKNKRVSPEAVLKICFYFQCRLVNPVSLDNTVNIRSI